MNTSSNPTLYMSAKKIFGSGSRLPDALRCIGWEHPEEKDRERSVYIPRINEGYVFRKEALEAVINFLNSPRGDALYISGPTGSGKTSLVLQIAARLGWPVQEVTCSERFETQDLIGSYVLSSDKPGEAPRMKFQYGVLPTAMRHGHILLINEWDIASPGELSALNTILEGGRLVIKETGGEVISPHSMFRIIVTGNSAGQGDSSGHYQGVLSQNLATMDRFRLIEVGYPTEAVERGILMKAVSSLDVKAVITPMIKTAAQVRQAFLDNAVSVTLSTRTLIRWANAIVDYQAIGDKSPIGRAFRESFLNRASEEDRISIEKMLSGSFPEGTHL